MSDLDLVSDDDLIDALLDRVDAGVICFRREGMKGPRERDITYGMTGDHHVCMGLCVDLTNYIYRQLIADRRGE